jgi:two-component system cell cycle sensor histidine kinase/response regulator CckA
MHLADDRSAEQKCNDFHADNVQHANSIILIMDAEGRIKFVNKFAKLFFGFPEHDILGRSVIGTIIPEKERSGRDLSEMIQNICNDPDRFSTNVNENTLKTGSRVWIAWTNKAIRDAQGRVRDIICIGNDITSIWKFEKEKQTEVENRYQKLLGAVTDYIYTVTVKNGVGVDTVHGPACEAVTGYTPEEYRNDQNLWTRMIVHDDKDAVLRQVDAAIRGTTSAPIEHRIVHKCGAIRWVKNTIVPHVNAQGTVTAYDGLVADITDRKNIEEQLYHAQKMEALGRMAGGVVHDLNNYLCVIIGQADLLLMKTGPEDPKHAKLDVIRVSAQKAADVARQLLAFSRKQVVEPTVFNVNDTIQGLGKVLHRLLGENVGLLIDLSQEFCHIRADRTQIEQVLVNLVVNARDAMPQGGQISIATGHEEIAAGNEPERANVEPGRYISICVKDTGTGMSDHIKQRIFDPFFTTKEKGKGTGLGLSTVYGIIKQSNGHIQVESEEGKGSMFRIYFPATYDTPKIKAEHPRSTASRPKDATILVIDDDEHIRSMTVEMLEQSGYRVLSACHGQDALSVLDQNGGAADLVISDVAMPKMNGFEFARKLAEKDADFRMIFMTAHIDNHEMLVDHGLKEERVMFLSKPFNHSTLLARVRECMEQ